MLTAINTAAGIIFLDLSKVALAEPGATPNTTFVILHSGQEIRINIRYSDFVAAVTPLITKQS